jgi:LmbE family N-acetylglucosaminyl deacetylase
MITISLDAWKRTGISILCLGAHSDDIEIGCGGSILRLLREIPGAAVNWVVFCATGDRAAEARASAEDFLSLTTRRSVRLFDFQDAHLPTQTAAVKREFESFKSLQPDLILTHFRQDLHQDHRVICELTWNTFRDHLILEYEVPKYDADLAVPNVFIPLDDDTCRTKLALLNKHFASQRSKHWFDDELFRGLLRLRGMECRSPTRYAEAFHGRKLVI